jgi:uncharacterized protein YfiM (DUF2279 family)
MDKLYHFCGCAVVAFGAGVLWKNPAAGYGVAVTAGILKEEADDRPGGSGYDKLDIRADVMGALVGSCAAMLVL